MQPPEAAQNIRHVVTTVVSAIAEQYSSLRLLRDQRLAILAVANVLDTMSSTIFVPFLPSLAEDIGASAFVIGLVFAVPAVVGAVATAPAGYLSDRWGRRPLIWTGVTFSALPVMAITFAWSPLVLLSLLGLDALLRAVVSPATNAYIGDTYTEEERGSAFGVYQTTAMIGAAAGPVIGGVLAELGGVRVPFLVLGAGTLIGGLILFAFLPPVDNSGNPEEEDLSDILPAFSRESIGIFLSVPAIAWLATAFINEFGTTTLNPIFPLLLRETVGRGPTYVGATYSALALAMLIFMPIGGRVSDRLGRVRVMSVTAFGWCVVMIGLTTATSPLIPPVLMFLGGVLSAFAAPASLALRYEIAPDGREATFGGITGTASSVGKAAGPLFAGVVTGAWGVRTTALAAGLSWLVAIPLFVLLIPETASSDD